MDEQIRRGLSAKTKQLPCSLLYDELGTALFEAITHLPEYGVTRAAKRLLHAHCHEALDLPGEIELVELGPGCGCQARILVEALRKKQDFVRFAGVDVSAHALSECKLNLERVPGVRVDVFEDLYVSGLRRAAATRAPQARMLVLFLGSNISNFTRSEANSFLAEVRDALRPGDALLLAADLDKPVAMLLPAYDDALGVTSAFNRNVLRRLNAEWGADFDLAAFTHEARWNAAERRVEMHLQAHGRQVVRVGKLALDLTLEDGETIWTESSHRFHEDELRAWAQGASFRWVRAWRDDEWPFVQALLEATGP